MDFDTQFIPQATRTESIVSEIKASPVAIHTLLATAYQLSLLVNEFKRAIYYGKEANMTKIANAILATAGGVSTIVDAIEGCDGNANRFVNDNELWLNAVDSIVGTDEDCRGFSLEKIDPRVLHAVFGVATEGPEISLPILRSIGGEEVDKVAVGEEFGDLDWYKAIALDSLGLKNSDIENAVIGKLKARYPDRFDADKAVNRNVEAERMVLEQGISPQ